GAAGRLRKSDRNDLEQIGYRAALHTVRRIGSCGRPERRGCGPRLLPAVLRVLPRRERGRTRTDGFIAQTATGRPAELERQVRDTAFDQAGGGLYRRPPGGGRPWTAGNAGVGKPVLRHLERAGFERG